MKKIIKIAIYVAAWVLIHGLLATIRVSALATLRGRD